MPRIYEFYFTIYATIYFTRMEDVKICRICLSMDVKLHDLKSNPLKSYYEVVMGNSIHSVENFPLFGCYICVALMKKFQQFREQCVSGQTILNGFLLTHCEITASEIQTIKEQKYILSPNFSTKKLLNIDINDEPGEENKDEIKTEPFEIENDNYFDDYDVVKEENPVENLLGATSDDEPLSFHKSNKEQKHERKKSKRGRKKKETKDKPNISEDIVEEQYQDETGDTATDLIAAVPVVVEKRKRGRPRKNKLVEDTVKLKPTKLKRMLNAEGVIEEDIDLETCCTIVQLTIEEQKEEINKRQQSSNYLNALYQCKLCYKGFIDTHAWSHHNRKHDPSSGEFECPVCRIRFKTKRTLHKHVTNHEKKYECKSCAYVSKTTTQAKQHQRWHKGVTYKCQYCDEISTQWTSHLSHVRIKHPSQFICNVCGYSFVSKLGLTMHKTMMHKDVEETLENEATKDSPYCVECDVKFTSEEAWKRHMVTSVKHTQGKDFNSGCRVCGERFPDAEQLRLHHRRTHARTRPRNYGKRRLAADWPAHCPHCSEEILNARDYWTHFRRAHPDKNYPIQKNYICDICGKSFRGNAFLVYHKRTHSAEKAFKCGVCPKAFFNRYNLQMHERTHSDHRPHACSVCYKAFKCKGALDRHFRSHTGEKPYACEVCGKAFAQSNSRKLHVRTVHLKQPSPYLSRARLERRHRHQ